MSILWFYFFFIASTSSQSIVYSENGNYMIPNNSMLLPADNASLYCQQHGSHLASIHNVDQQQEAMDLCVSIFGFSSNYGCTIGLNDKTNEAGSDPTATEWEWSDNTPFDYNYWHKNGPIQPNGNQNENCVGLLITYFGAWFDISCNAQLVESTYEMGFLCNTPPTNEPTKAPSQATPNPSSSPSEAPTSFTNNPSQAPSYNPSTAPTHAPTIEPTYDPTVDPTRDPTTEPTYNPTVEPTAYPTIFPTILPTYYPTYNPTSDPSNGPTYNPSYIPTNNPSIPPTLAPTKEPTKEGSVGQEISTTVYENDIGEKGTEKKSPSTALTVVISIFSVMCVVICVAVGLWIASCVGSKEKSDNSQVEMNRNQSQDNVRDAEEKEEERDVVKRMNSEEIYGPGDNPIDHETVGKDPKRSLTQSVDKKVNDENADVIEGERDPNGEQDEEGGELLQSEGNIKANLVGNNQETDQGENEQN